MPETVPQDKIADLRKKLLFRSWHRGTREIDLMLGRFADAHVPSFTPAELEEYERLLCHSDPDLYDWMTGRVPVPAAEDGAVMQRLTGFYKEKKVSS